MGSSHSNIEEVRLNEDTLEDEVTMAFMKSDIDIAIIKEPDRDLRKRNMKLLRRMFTKLDPNITIPQLKSDGECGCIHLAFRKHENVLMVKVIGASNLDPMDMRSVSADVYIKIFLTSGGIMEQQIQKTQVVRNSLKPTFNEIFSFKLNDSIKDYKIKFEVWDFDMLTHDDFMGEISFDVNSIAEEQQDLYELHDKIDICISGSIKVRVEHQLPSKLTVVILSARDIGKNAGDLPSSFIALEIPESETALQQTEVVYKNDNPKWNQTFVFNVSREEFVLRKIFFNVIEYSRIGRNHSLGSAVLSLNGLNNEAKLEKRLILQDSKVLDLRNQNRSVLTQEYRESLIAHAQIKLPNFIFHGCLSSKDMIMKLACNKSSTVARMKIKEGCPIY